MEKKRTEMPRQTEEVKPAGGQSGSIEESGCGGNDPHGPGSHIGMAGAEETFLANMSHEMKTPLNGIMGMASLLHDSGLTDEQRRQVEMILEASESLRSIVDNVLDYSTMEKGLWRCETETFEPGRMLQECLAPCAVEAYCKGLEFGCIISSGVPHTLRGCREDLHRLLVNLASNAVKFTDRGYVVVRCEVENRRTGTIDLHFTVSDTGKGIDPGNLQAVFHRFTQEDGSLTRRYGGAGLGLAICKQLAERMGGTIRAESIPGSHTDFHCIVPLETVPAKTGGGASAPPIAGPVMIVAPGECPNAEALKASLERWSIPSRHVRNPAAAFAVGKRFGFLVLDGSLADHEEIGFFQKLRGIFGDNNMAVLATPSQHLTWHGDKRFDGIRVVPKPVFPTTLREFLKGSPCPIVVPLPADTSSRDTTDETRNSSGNRDVKRILVAEDNEISRIFVRKTLRGSGYHVVIAHNGAEAVEKYLSEPFDLILMDIQMPVMDGLEAARRIRGAEDTGAEEQRAAVFVPQRGTSPCRGGAESRNQKAEGREQRAESSSVIPASKEETSSAGRARARARNRNRNGVPIRNQEIPNQKIRNPCAACTELSRSEHGRSTQSPIPVLSMVEARNQKGVPIIALTASTPEKDWSACRSAGIDGFIAKPVSAQVLKEKIAAVLGDSRDRCTRSSSGDIEDDYQRALAGTGGDTELFAELLDIVVQRWPGLVETVRRAYEARNNDEIAEALHAIKGSVNTFARPDFVPRMVEYMNHARAGTPPALEDLLNALADQHQHFEQLRRHCAGKAER